MDAPLIIAHRTSPAYAPENSVQGIRASFEQGADGVEIDLRMSLDLQPFLMHDNSMHRTTGWWPPIELTPAAIVRRQTLRNQEPGTRNQEFPASEQEPTLRDASRGNDPPGSETVPSLAEAMDAVPPGKLFAVDVKTPWAIVPLIKAVRQRAMQSQTLVWCSSGLVVRYAVRHLPGAEVAFYKDYDDRPNNIEFIGKAARIGAQAVSLYWPGVSRDVVAAAHALGLKVYSWHKEFPITAEKLATGLDGLITDDPAMARETVEGLRQVREAQDA